VRSANFTNGAVTCFSLTQDGHNLLFGKSLLHRQISFDLMILMPRFYQLLRPSIQGAFQLPCSSEAFVYLAMIRLMLKRMGKQKFISST
jgi:hypothetical protein